MIDENPTPQLPASSQSNELTADIIAQANKLLDELLQSNDGVVSSVQLKRELVTKEGFSETIAGKLLYALQFPDTIPGCESVKTYHHGRSFYSEAKYNEVLSETKKEADAKGLETEEVEEEPQQPIISRQNRQEEARLGAYVKTMLEDIYASEFVPDEAEYVFDVHSERPGSAYENVDLVAVHWRSEKIVDLVSVEVKLDFSATAVHQACSYARFSNRVWIAAVVSSDISEAALELRGNNPGLFDYVISRGIGIIACRRRQGGAYQPVPIHWPCWQSSEPVEKEQFLERYRSWFEQAEVIEPLQRRRAARF